MDETGKINIRSFFKRRALKILPAYYFLLLVYFILQLVGTIKLSSPDWFYSLTILKQFNNPGGLTGHLWSISAEEFFYLFYPPFFIWLYPKNKKALNYLLLAVVLAIIPLCRIFITQRFETYGFNIFMRGDAIAIGCLLALNYNILKPRIEFIQPRTWLGIPVLFFINSLLFSPEVSSNYPSMILWGEAGWSLPDNLVIAFLLILAMEDRRSIVFAILNSAPMVFLGRVSYSIYLWQQIFTSNLPLGYFNFFPFNLLMILVASVLSYKLIEQPFLQLKNRAGPGA